MDVTAADGAFYTETFHSAAWTFHGDEVSASVPPGLNTRSRAASGEFQLARSRLLSDALTSGVLSVRERTVRISRGRGEYPWGFRIQFSKPIVVTEVDTSE